MLSKACSFSIGMTYLLRAALGKKKNTNFAFLSEKPYLCKH